jgi:predicted dithiol-disulfide oxidoreductase (DUF899 family)
MRQHRKVVSHDEWLDARKQLLIMEKEFNRLCDQMSEHRRRKVWRRSISSTVLAAKRH